MFISVIEPTIMMSMKSYIIIEIFRSNPSYTKARSKFNTKAKIVYHTRCSIHHAVQRYPSPTQVYPWWRTGVTCHCQPTRSLQLWRNETNNDIVMFFELSYSSSHWVFSPYLCWDDRCPTEMQEQVWYPGQVKWLHDLIFIPDVVVPCRFWYPWNRDTGNLGWDELCM